MDVKFTCIRVDINTEISASNFEQGHYLDVKFTCIRDDAHITIGISTLILNIIWMSNSLASEPTLRNTEIRTGTSDFERISFPQIMYLKTLDIRPDLYVKQHLHQYRISRVRAQKPSKEWNEMT